MANPRSMHSKLIKVLQNPRRILLHFLQLNIFFLLPDKFYLQILYKIRMGKKLDLKNPKTYSEKLQWLKLYDHNPLYKKLVDKYEVRKYVADTIGENYLIPLLGVWNAFDQINFNELPNQFVLKCTHDSGSVLICTDKATWNVNIAKKKLNKCMKRDYFYLGREWPYKDIKPRIIAEEYIVDESGTQLKDYKIFCFHGKPRMIEVDFDRFIDHKRNVYDTNWNYLNIETNYPAHPEIKIDKPKELNTMLILAEKLASDFPHVRVDFYTFDHVIYFSEITFYHASGMGKITPLQFFQEMGSWINLDQVKKENS